MGAEGIGAKVLRKEDERLLRGRGRFVDDIDLPGLKDVAFLRSAQAHARIRGISKPDGGMVLVAADFAGLKPIVTRSSIAGYKVSSYPPIAERKVRYVGDIVAVAVARTRGEAEDVCGRIEVDFEPLPAIVDAHQGRAERRPLIHEEWNNNLFLELSIDSGVDDIIRNAPVKVTRQYRTARQCMLPLEGKGIVAYWDFQADQLVIITSTQIPHLIRSGIAEFLDIDTERLRIVTPDVGGGFGYKCQLQPEELLVAYLARKHRAPFRWIEDRREHLVAGANAREHHYNITAYADANGRLLALDAEVMVDTGAYSVWPFTACLEAAQAGGNLPGPYDFRGYRCKVFSVATNKPPFMPYRGVARPGVCFAMELTIDAIARAVGREPVDVRADNLVPASAMPYTNVTNKHYDSGDYVASLRSAQALIGFDAVRKRQEKPEPDGTLIGVGFATYTEQSAHGTKVFAAWGLPFVPGFEQATVKLTPDGGLEIRVGIVTIGQGLETTLAQVASEILTIPISRISVKLGDTATTPFSTGAYASRGIVMAGGAVSKSAQKLAERIKRIGGHLLQAQAADVSFKDGRIVAGGASLDFADVGRAWYLRPERLPDDVDTGGLEVTEGYKPLTDGGVFSYASHAAVVAVDPRTGFAKILDYVVVEDCGRVVNPVIVEGQTCGGVAQGIGTALFEESTYDAQGQPLASTLMDYLFPGSTDLPVIRLAHTETLSPYSAHGIKGVGEGGAIAPAGAVVSAINDALRPLGAELSEIPATPPRVLAAIEAARVASSRR